MQSFVILVGRGYTGDAKSAEEMFDAIAGSTASGPFEFDLIVAEGPGIAGRVLIFYLEDGFAGVPANLSSYDFNGGFLGGWLASVCPISQPRYSVEYYGPRSHSLEGYWPGIQVLKRLKKSATAKAPSAGETGSARVPERATGERPAAKPGKKGSWWRQLFSEEASWDPEWESAVAPPPPAPPPPPDGLAFSVRSLEVTQDHEYGQESERKTITASGAYRLVVAVVTIANTSDRPRRFSSQQLVLLDSAGRAVKGDFYGVGDTIAESGAVISTESTTRDSSGEVILTFKGKLSPDVSFIEWELHPHQEFSDSLVFLIEAGVDVAGLALSGG